MYDIIQDEKSHTIMNPCPTGPTGPPGVTGSRGAPGRVDNDIVFDKLSILVAPLGSDSDFELGNINKPCQTIQTAVDAVPDGGTIHIIPGTYAGFTCNSKPALSIRGWGDVSINDICTVDNGFSIILERLDFNTGLVARNYQSCIIRSCVISLINPMNIDDIQIRGCTFIATAATTYIEVVSVTKCLIQSCLFIGTAIDDIIFGGPAGIILRDNLIRWDGLSVLADNISNPQGRIVISHNGAHVLSANSITPATGSLFNANVHHNSFHNLTPNPIPYVTEGKLFNNAINVTYTNPDLRVGNFNDGKLMTSHTRSVHTVSTGTYTMIGDVTIVYVSGPGVTVELPPPVNGLIVEISVAPGAGGTVTSPDTIDVPPWGSTATSVPLASSTFMRLQWIAARSTWIGSVGTVTVP